MTLAKIETTHVFDGTVEKVFKGIRNFEEYSNYLPGVTSIEVLPAKVDGSICQVRYDINLIKKFHYVLDMFEEEPNKLWWTLNESNLMKFNEGHWDLTAKGKTKTSAIYKLEVKFKGLVPSVVTDKVAKASLPSLFEGFQQIIDL